MLTNRSNRFEESKIHNASTPRKSSKAPVTKTVGVVESALAETVTIPEVVYKLPPLKSEVQDRINANYLTTPGSKLINGKVIMPDGFNITDASLDEKSDYMHNKLK